MTIRALLLDIGGVLEHTPQTGWHQRWCDRFKLDPDTFRSRLAAATVGGDVSEIDERVITNRVAGEFGCSGVDAAALLDDMWVEYLGEPNLELIEFTRALRPPLRVGILSNSFTGAREREERYGFDEIADVILYSHETGLLKPDPRAFQLACGRLGVAPAETLFVDDLPGHVEAAQAVGLLAVLFTDTSQVIAAMTRLLG